MSKSTKSRTYNDGLFALASAPRSVFPVRIPLGSAREAMAWRLDFYSFRSAMRREGDARTNHLEALKVRIEGNTVVVEDAATAGVGSAAVLAAISAALMRANAGVETSGETPQSTPPQAAETDNSLTHGNDAVMRYLRGESI